MELTIKARNTHISDRQRAYIEEKLGKLTRHMAALNRATVEVSAENHRSQGTIQRIQVTLLGDRGVMLRAEERAAELHAAMDGVQETLQKQIHRFKDRSSRRNRTRRADMPEELLSPPADEADEDEHPQIVRTKQFAVKPMSSEEAVEQMELIGHDFFVFRDADSGSVNVLYRRKDGNYGMIVPEMAE